MKQIRSFDVVAAIADGRDCARGGLSTNSWYYLARNTEGHITGQAKSPMVRAMSCGPLSLAPIV